MPARTLAGFSLATLGVSWVALASRQLLSIPDEDIHLAISASIRAGQFPPVLSWIPDMPLPYHYGADLLIGLLMPPAGPDLAFTTEVVGAFMWTGFVLVVAAALMRKAGVSALMLTPLLLTAGAWSLIWYADAPHILQVVVPTGIPGPGIRASLGDIFWPSVSLPWTWPGEASPPNIWKPPFIHTYALGFIVVERAAAAKTRTNHATWPLALLIGFMGLMAEEIAVLALALWAGLETLRYLRARQMHTSAWRSALRMAAGPLVAVLLLILGGGVLTSMLTGVEGKDLSLGWHADPGSRRPLGAFDAMPGGIGIIGLGVLPVALTAVLLAQRNRLVLAFAAASGGFLVAALVLQYEPAGEVTRLDGHARNFALLALLVGLSVSLPRLRPRWRYAALASIAALVIWPTIVTPARSMALALSRGLHIANAQENEREFNEWVMGRAVISPLRSERIAAYIRNRTTIDARVFSPHPHSMTVSTGRPNASGFPTLIHLFAIAGAEYEDTLRFLEPSAVQRLGFRYLHASDEWVVGLPNHAQQWLQRPDLFEPLIRDGPMRYTGFNPPSDS